MHPDALKALARLCDLVEEGELPEEAIPRLFYYGHHMVHGIREAERRFKCVHCKYEWRVEEDHKSTPVEFADSTCPQCGKMEEVYDITGDDQKAKWRCRVCRGEWVGEDGYECPHCHTIVDNCGKTVQSRGEI